MASKESDSTKGSEYSTEQASEASSPGSHAISYQTTVGAYQNFVNFGVSIMTCKYCYQNLHITLEYWNNTVSMYKWRPFFPGPFLPRNPQNRTNVLCILCYIYKYFTSLLCPVILIQLCILQKKKMSHPPYTLQSLKLYSIESQHVSLRSSNQLDGISGWCVRCTQHHQDWFPHAPTIPSC